LHYLQDKETRDFIYEFIERHGGVDAALMEEDDASVTQIIAPQPGGFSRSTSGPTLPPRNSSISHPAPPSKVQASPGKFVLQRLKSFFVFLFIFSTKEVLKCPDDKVKV